MKKSILKILQYFSQKRFTQVCPSAFYLLRSGIICGSNRHYLVSFTLGILTAMCESSHRRCSVKKTVLKDLAMFTGRHLCCSLLLIKLQSCRPVLKKHLRTATSQYEYSLIFSYLNITQFAPLQILTHIYLRY